MTVTRLKKAAKADGIDLGALKRIEAYRKLDEDEVEIQIRHVTQYAGFLGMSLGTQTSLPLPPDQPEQMEWEAGEAGYLAGKGGKLRSDNPFPEGSPLFVAWDKQFVRGLKILAADMGAKADKAKAKLEENKPAITSVADMRSAPVPPAESKGRRGRRPSNVGQAGAVH